MSEALKEMLLPELRELRSLLEVSRAELAGKESEIADKEAEIAQLKRMLAEARGES